MFELTISKQQLLAPLLVVASAVDKKQSLAILANILLKLNDGQLCLSATDLDIEISADIDFITSHGDGITTVPTKKIIDIIRSLDDNTAPLILFDSGIITINQGRTKFKLAALPADNYPSSELEPSEAELYLGKNSLVYLLQSTNFAMSQQDVRIFLNGLLLEVDAKFITAVATDGHRMAICRIEHNIETKYHRLLIPRKSVHEILRLLNHIDDEYVLLSLARRHIGLKSKQYKFSTRLIEARFPSYAKAIPGDQDKQVIIDRDLLKRALLRIVILAHEKSRAILLHISKSQLTLVANNHEQEEASEVLCAETTGGELSIGINAGYLLDVLQHIEDGFLSLSFASADSSVLVKSLNNSNYNYVIMPMKI